MTKKQRPETEHFSSSPEVVSDSVEIYMQSTRRHELLDPETEASLAKQVCAGSAAQELLDVKNGDSVEIAPNTEEATKLQQIKELGESAVNQLIESNLRLVVFNAHKLRHEDEQLKDVIQDGNLGLIRAVEKFDPAKGYRFTTYATWWIKQAIQRGQPNNSSRTSARFPMHIQQELYKLDKATYTIDDEGISRAEYVAKVAEKSGFEESKVTDLLRYRDQFSFSFSFDQTVGEDDDATLADITADTSQPKPDEEALSAVVGADLRYRLTWLDDRERTVVALRFGLVDGKDWTLEEIGQELGLTRERIRQIQKKSIEKLKTTYHEDGYEVAS